MLSVVALTVEVVSVEVRIVGATMAEVVRVCEVMIAAESISVVPMLVPNVTICPVVVTVGT
jgi:hypothetical protein